MSAHGKLCRLCAEIANNAKNIYDNDYDNVQYISKFKQLFSDIVFQEDCSLPEHICSNCCTKLKGAYNFKKQCMSSMEYLKKCKRKFQERKPENSNLKDVHIKQEENLNELLTENTSENIECDTSTDFVILRNCTETEKVEECQELRSKFAEIQKDDKEPNCDKAKQQELCSETETPNLLHNLDWDPLVVLEKAQINFGDYKFCSIIKEEVDIKENITEFIDNNATEEIHEFATTDEQNEEENPLQPDEKSFAGVNLQNQELAECNFEEERVEEGEAAKTRMIEREKEEKVYNCEECHKQFDQNRYLKRHVMVVHRDKKKPYICNECHKQFSWKHTLTKHVKSVHRGIKPYSCEECQKKFDRKGGLERHMEVHSGVKFYSCKECPEKFSQKDNLKDHTINVHGGVKQYSCVECDKHFSWKNDLKRHVMSVHKGLKPYSCKECPKKFSQKNKLEEHTTIVHRGVKPYCKECHKHFSWKSALKLHMTSVHEGLKPYSCKVCQKKFGQKRDLEVHVKRVHR